MSLCCGDCDLFERVGGGYQRCRVTGRQAYSSQSCTVDGVEELVEELHAMRDAHDALVAACRSEATWLPKLLLVLDSLGKCGIVNTDEAKANYADELERVRAAIAKAKQE